MSIFKLKLDYKFLKTFGCSCFPFLRDYNTHKFHFHTSKYIFLGYSPLHKGCKCLHSSGKKKYTSSHVLFDETSFLYLFNSNFLNSHSKPFDFHYNLLQLYTVHVFNSNSDPFEAIASLLQVMTLILLMSIIFIHILIVLYCHIHIYPYLHFLINPQIDPLILPPSKFAQLPKPIHLMITREKAGIFKLKAFLITHNSLKPLIVSEALFNPK